MPNDKKDEIWLGIRALINQFVNSLPDKMTFVELVKYAQDGNIIKKFADIINEMTKDDSGKKSDL